MTAASHLQNQSPPTLLWNSTISLSLLLSAVAFFLIQSRASTFKNKNPDITHPMFLTSRICHLPRSMSLISSSSSSPSSSTGFIGTSLFSISLKYSTHLCSLSPTSVLSTPCFPSYCLTYSKYIAPCCYHVQWPFLLLQPSLPSNSSYPP